MKTSEKHPKMVNISAHIPYELAQRLEKVAKIEERTKSYYVKKSLESYLEDLEDYLIAEKISREIREGKREVVSWEEVQRNAGLLDG